MGSSESRVQRSRDYVAGDGLQRQFYLNKQGLRFHSVHGRNITLSEDQRKAKRVNSFCYGITFSDRSITINEKVYLKLTTVETSWSGVLRLGVTNRDPSTTNCDWLPRYACPDLTSQNGYWAKALPDEFAEEENVLIIYVDYNGNLHLSLDGENQSNVLISGIDINLPLWVMVDIYGNTTELEFVRRNISPTIEELERTFPSVQPYVEPSLVDYNQSDAEDEAEDSSHQIITRLPFSDVAGQAVTLFQENHLAYSNLYANMFSSIVFSAEPIQPGTTWYLKRLPVNNNSDVQFDDLICMAIGVTSCNPEFLDRYSLPSSWNELVERPEYWVLEQLHVDNIPNDDEIFSITLGRDGYLRFRSLSGITGPEVRLLYCDVSQSLWLTIDISIAPCILASIGVSSRPEVDISEPSTSGITGSQRSGSRRTEARESHFSSNRSSSTSDAFLLPSSTFNPVLSQPPDGDETDSDESFVPIQSHSDEETGTSIVESDAQKPHISECSICCEVSADAAIYDCGHVCFCMQCGKKLISKQRHPKCPICRKPIKDIIKLYHA